MRVQILCDSCCDFTATERLCSAFAKVPAAVTVSGQRFVDDKAFHQAALLQALAEPSMELKVEFPDERAYLNAMDPEAEEVYVVTSSAAVSDQYETASRARRMLLRTSPDRKVHVFNSRSGGVGELLTARRVWRMQRSGCSFRQIVERVEAEILTASLYLLPASPEALRQSGLIPRRRGPLERPRGVYGMSLEGDVVRLASALGDQGAERKLAGLLADRKTAGKTCLIAHCGCIDRARRLSQTLKQSARFSEILLVETGAVTSLLLQRGGLAAAF